MYVYLEQYFVFDDVVYVGEDGLVQECIIDYDVWQGFQFVLGQFWILGIVYYVCVLIVDIV